MNIDVDILIVIGIFFIIGFLISYILKSQKTSFTKTLPPLQRDNNLEIIEIMENKKQLQIDNIMLKLKDIQINLDLLESKFSTIESSSRYEKNIKNSTNITDRYDMTSQGPHVSNITNESLSNKPPIEKERSNSSMLNGKYNATEHYILKIIFKDPLTSNEIKKSRW